MERVDGMQEQMGNVSKAWENQESRRNIRGQKHKMKNVFSGLISRLDAAEEGISELEEISIETLKTGKKRDKV